MLTPFDELMRQAILDRTSLAVAEQVRFQPPDEALQADVVALNEMVLDIYLVDIRQNRQLRSNARERVNLNGTTWVEPAPERIDCHYLATAWSPVNAAPGLEPTLDEHALLYEVIAAMMPPGVLNPRRVYPPLDPRLLAWPQPFRDVDLPFQVLSVEGYGKTSEFWSTMGHARWKPVLHLIATLPVALARTVAGPPVTTSITRFQQDALTATAETWINIGGSVRRALGGGVTEEVDGAWVRIETLGGVPLALVTTDEQGRFVFDRLRPGQYQLRTGAPGEGPLTRVVDVPSATGEYDLEFP